MRRRRTVPTRSKASSSTSPSTSEASAPADPAGPLPDLLAGLPLGASGPSGHLPLNCEEGIPSFTSGTDSAPGPPDLGLTCSGQLEVRPHHACFVAPDQPLHT